MNTSKMLRDLARRNGLCDQFFTEWDLESTEQELLDKYLAGMNFCIKHDFPSADVIRTMFHHELLNENNIYIDDRLNLYNPTFNKKTNVVSICGTSHGNIWLDSLSVTDLFVQHDCQLNIECRGMSKAFITLTGNAKIRVTQDDAAFVAIYKKSKESSYEAIGDVKVRDQTQL